MMKKISILTVAAIVSMLLGGCYTTPEYFDELTREELNVLRNAARMLAIKGNAVPEHMKLVFVEMEPYERIVYDGDKSGKASFRWEIYDVPRNAQQITQQDVNPYWVMVYATGDLRDPKWKLTHAHEDTSVPASGRNTAPAARPGTTRTSPPPAARPNSNRPVQRVRSRR